MPPHCDTMDGPVVKAARSALEVRADLKVQEAASMAEEVERRVHQRTGSGYCVIHVDAAPKDTASGEVTTAKAVPLLRE